MQAVQLPVACHPHPMTDERMLAYAERIETLPGGQLKDILRRLWTCVNVWWEIPTFSSKAPKQQWRGVPGKEYDIVELEPEMIAKLDEHTPWPYELDAMQRILDTLPDGQGDEVAATPTSHAYRPVVDEQAHTLKKMAFELLIFAQQIARDWEPVTSDRLK